MTPIRYHEAAEDELLHEIAFYEQRLPGLGRRFHEAVTHAEHRIAQFPDSGREFRPKLRQHNLRQFPYALIYATAPDHIVILAIAHHRRRPGYWIDRLGAEG